MEILFPRSLDELGELFAAHPGGRILAGGTDLLVQLRETEVRPSALFSLDRLEPLRRVEETAAGIFIGAAVTHEQLRTLPVIKERLPLLQAALSVLGSPPIRHSGTLGGNLCTASPAGDTLPPLYVINARVDISGPAGARRVPIAEFIQGPGRTILGAGEIVTGVYVGWPAANSLSAYYKVGKRKALAIAVASMAALWEETADHTVKTMALAWGSVGPTILRLTNVEEFLQGKVLTDEVLRQAGELAAESVSPIDDIRGSAAYRRRLAANLLLRLGNGD